ncbi:MAG: ERAP1-like C-terminal domain-containing protein, partial [Candidatus Dormibacteraeota bacterium]|nr:ERAP1-like C-terminal domain-containing protein [Candidatus Dormibacteraeota bacterium]
ARGASGEELIEAELQRDQTDQGRRQAAAARAAIPTAEAKSAAWELAAVDTSQPLATVRAVIAGFQDGEQPDLLRPYVEPYFAGLDRVWSERPPEAALTYIGGFYPRAIISEEVVDRTSRALDQDLAPPVRRVLLEARDGMQRALRARAYDAGPD